METIEDLKKEITRLNEVNEYLIFRVSDFDEAVKIAIEALHYYSKGFNYVGNVVNLPTLSNLNHATLLSSGFQQPKVNDMSDSRYVAAKALYKIEIIKART